MDIDFIGEVWYWRGPAPFHFVTVPPAEAELIAELAPGVTYGWGMVPARVTIGATTITTSLWPKDGGYIVPIRRMLQDAEEIGVGDSVEVTLGIG